MTGAVRLSVTARLALLAILVSLASSFVLIAVIRQQVTSDALTVLQRDIGEQAATYRSVARSGGLPALRRAIANAIPGDVVLLSPACASFDQFKDYEQRGERFRQFVAALTEDPTSDPCAEEKVA